MNNLEFWMWTIFVMFLSYTFVKVLRICYSINNDDLVYVPLKPRGEKMYTIQSNKIDWEKV